MAIAKYEGLGTVNYRKNGGDGGPNHQFAPTQGGGLKNPTISPQPVWESREQPENGIAWNENDPIYRWAFLTGLSLIASSPHITEKQFMQEADTILAPDNHVRLTDTKANKTHRIAVYAENQYGQKIRPTSLGDIIRAFLAEPKDVYEDAVRHAGRLLHRPKIIVTQHTDEPFKPRLRLGLDYAHHLPDEFIAEALQIGRDILNIPGAIAGDISKVRRNIARGLTKLAEQRRDDPLTRRPKYIEFPFQRIPSAAEEVPQITEKSEVTTQLPPTIYGEPIIRKPRVTLADTGRRQPNPADQGIRWDAGTRAPGAELKAKAS